MAHNNSSKLSKADQWNPLAEDFNNVSFNSYDLRAANRSSQFCDDQLFVTGIPQSMTEEGLRNLLSSVGQVKSIKLIQDNMRSNKKIGFVRVVSKTDAMKIIGSFNSHQINDDCLRISFSKVRSDQPRKSYVPSKNSSVVSNYSTQHNVNFGGQSDSSRQSDGRGDAGRYVEMEHSSSYFNDKVPFQSVATNTACNSTLSAQNNHVSVTTDICSSPTSYTDTIQHVGQLDKHVLASGDCSGKKLSSCVVCQKQANHKCGKCKLVSYCSRDCQTIHWSSHKLICVKKTSMDTAVSDLALPETIYPTAGKYLTTNMEISIKVLQVISPSQFWIHNLSSSDLAKLDDMHEAMTKHYSSLPTKSGFRPNGSKLYAALVKETGKWYRVLALKFTTESVRVFFLDSSKMEDVLLTTLQSLEGQFLKLPFQAICCSLSDLSGICNTSWDLQVVNYMRQLVINEQSLSATVCRVDGYNISIEAYLKSGQSVSALVKLFAINHISKSISDNSSQQPIKLQCIDKVHSHVDPKFSFDPHNDPSTTKYQCQNEENNTYTEDVQKILQNDVLLVKVLHCVSPTNITVCSLPDFTPLQSLMVELNSLHNNGGYRPHLDELVAAQYSGDLLWYRAQVISDCGNSSFKVIYIDYGNDAVIDIKLMAMLEPKFSIQPVWSQSVALLDAQKFESSWPTGFLESYNELQMVVVEKCNGQNVVQFYEVGNVQSITDKLLKSSDIYSKVPISFSHYDSSSQAKSASNLLYGGSEVTVMFAESPSSFYVSATTDSALFSEATSLMNQLCSQSTVCNDQFTVGMLLAALYDGIWCRARIVDIVDACQLKLFFIDFGNSSIQPVTDVSILPSGLPQELPAQAIWCTLTDHDSRWSPDAVMWFKETCEYQSFKVVVVHNLDDKGQCLVDIRSTENQPTVKQMLIANGYICETPDTMKNENADQSMSNVVPDALKNSSLSNNCVPAFDAAVQPVADAEVHSWCQQANEVLIVHVNTPSDFYIQTTKIDTLSTLSQIMNKMKEMCNNTSNNQMPIVGDVVAARFVDGEWYRAEVKELKSNNECLVHFIDYGNTSVLNKCDLRQIQADVASALPKLAVHCCIDRVIGCGVDGKWSQQAIEWFNTCCLDHKFILKFVFKNATHSCDWNVDLLDYKTGVSAREVLLEKHFANPVSYQDDNKFNHKPTNGQDIVTPCQSVLSFNNSEVTNSAHLMTRIVKSRALHPGMVVIITAIISPSDFSVQITDDTNKYVKMMIELNETCWAASENYQPQKVGEIVAAKHDNYWYRVEVKEIHQCIVTVFCFDYGVTHQVDVSNICSLPLHFIDGFPQQSTHCSIDGISGSCADGVFSENAIDWFRQSYLRKECTLIDVFQRSDKCYVNLCSSDNNESVRDYMLINGLATTCVSTPSQQHGVNENISQINTNENNEVSNMCTTQVETHKHQAMDVQALKLNAGDTVVVVDAETPSDFYVRYQNNMLFDIQMKIKLAISCCQPYQPKTVGELIALKYDDCWYRARVVDISLNKVVVHYIDFGHTSTSSTPMYCLPKGCIDGLPQQAAHCVLLGFEDLADVSHEICHTFRRYCENTVFCVKQAVQTGERYAVELVDIKTGENICDILALHQIVDVNTKASAVNVLYTCGLSTASLPLIANVRVSFSNTFVKFYCYSVSEVESLQKKIKLLCTSDSAGELQQNELCCAFLSEIGEWCRAVIEEITIFSQKQRYTVMCVDYGCKTTVDISRIRKCPAELLNTPALAVPCTLAHLNTKHIVSALKCFQELVGKKILTARTVSVDKFGTHHVELTTNEASALYINDELIRRDVATSSDS